MPSLSAFQLVTNHGGRGSRVNEPCNRIETGKWADMIVLNHNLIEIPETDIHKTEVQQTLFKGDVVYEAP
jgi:predicted amidohydrolase YtcJ